MTSMTRIWITLLAGALAAGCVTINIYFPAAAAEKAADKIIEEVWQLQKSETRPAPGEPGAAPAAEPAGQPRK